LVHKLCEPTFDRAPEAIYDLPMKVSLTAHQEKFVGKKMKGGGYLSRGEVIREALRVYELVEEEDADPELEAALRHSLETPLKKYRPGHFARLANRNGRKHASR